MTQGPARCQLQLSTHDVQSAGMWPACNRPDLGAIFGIAQRSARAANGLDADAYRCVGAAVRNRQNQRRPTSPLRPVVTRRVRDWSTHQHRIDSPDRCL